MNRVLVVSDSHGLTNELVDIQKRHQADKYLHVGDSELDTESVYLAGYESVLGNCDWQATYPKTLTIDIAGIRIFITHGHLYGVKSSLLKLQYAAIEQDAQIVCYGHSHIPHCEKIDGQIYVNPGSIRLPRNYPKPTYIIIEWDDPSEIAIQYYDLAGNRLEDLSQNIQL